MNRIYSVDRIGETAAVLVSQGTRTIQVPRDMLAADIREGMLVSFQEDRGLYCCDTAATEKKQAEVKAGVDALLKRGKKA